MTYAESQNEAPFDWNEFLERAIKGDISHSEHLKAIKLANSWVTCACGNQCSSVPRFEGGRPFDMRLGLMGIEFMTSVEFGYWRNAKEILERIEERSVELIREINAQTH